MELSELAAVGRASMSVAIVGVIVPIVGGAAFGSAIGMTGKEALFVGAALTATSVGITARASATSERSRWWRRGPCSAPRSPTT